MLGQITLGTPLGNIIYELTKREDVQNIVEIGTWNGKGSTLCVIQALVDIGNRKNFCSVELYPKMYYEAQSFLKEYSNYVKLLHGKIIEYDEVFWFDHSSLDFSRGSHAALYYREDLLYLKHSRNVLNELPETIDLLILDGGEYTTYPEWIKLKDRTKIVVLDDSAILKCQRIRQEILDSNQYITLHDDLEDRNGYAVFQRI